MGNSATSARWVWIALLIPASLVFSLAFACATPFAAFAALAATYFRRAEGAVLVLGVWLINQAVGFGLLGYPMAWDSFGWGAAIGIAALAGYGAAKTFFLSKTMIVIRWLAPFAAAFVTYELVLFAAAFALPSGSDAFSIQTVSRILIVNAVAYVGLLAAQHLAMNFGGILAPRPQITTR
ncbi:hypothetical protein [Aestuariivirga sp.]|uniref:hypothetical protein n=1 Tax=Aestuariivirga sp. TaxID=2650926 RepID=UPI0039E4C52C